MKVSTKTKSSLKRRVALMMAFIMTLSIIPAGWLFLSAEPAAEAAPLWCLSEQADIANITNSSSAAAGRFITCTGTGVTASLIDGVLSTSGRNSSGHGFLFFLNELGVPVNLAANEYIINIAGRMENPGGGAAAGVFRVDGRDTNVATITPDTTLGSDGTFSVEFTIPTTTPAWSGSHLRLATNSAGEAMDIIIDTLTVERVPAPSDLLWCLSDQADIANIANSSSAAAGRFITCTGTGVTASLIDGVLSTSGRTSSGHGFLFFLNELGVPVNLAANEYIINIAGRMENPGGGVAAGVFRVDGRNPDVGTIAPDSSLGADGAFSVEFTIPTTTPAWSGAHLRLATNTAGAAMDIIIDTLTVERVSDTGNDNDNDNDNDDIPRTSVAEWQFNLATVISDVMEIPATGGSGVAGDSRSGATAASLRRHKVDPLMTGSGANQHMTVDGNFARIWAWVGGVSSPSAVTHHDYFGNYAYLQLSTEGYENLQLSFSSFAQGTSTAGQLRLEYQVGGDITDPWTPIPGGVITYTAALSTVDTLVDLPAALEDEPLVRIRFIRYVPGFEPVRPDYRSVTAPAGATGPGGAGTGRSSNIAFSNIVVAGVSEGETTSNDDEPKTLFISEFGDEYYFYGITSTATSARPPLAAIFDEPTTGNTTDWGHGATPIGYGRLYTQLENIANSAALDDIDNYRLTFNHGGAHSTAYDGGGTLIPGGFGPTQWRTDLTDVDLASGVPRMRHHAHTVFRRTFELDFDPDVYEIAGAFGRHIVKNGLILYVNGIEVYRFGFHNEQMNPANAIGGGYTLGASMQFALRDFTIDENANNRAMPVIGTRPAYMTDAASLTNLQSALRPGTNVLTAVIGQQDRGPNTYGVDVSAPHSENSRSKHFNLELAVMLEEREQVEPIAISEFGDSYYFYGTSSGFSSSNPEATVANMFNMEGTAGWGYGSTPIGFGQLNLVTTIANAIPGIDNSRLTFNHGGDFPSAYDGGGTLIPVGHGPAYWRTADAVVDAQLRHHQRTVVRRSFEMPDFDPDYYGAVRAFGRHIIDDGLILFVNGVEVYRFNGNATQGHAGNTIGGDITTGTSINPALRGFVIDGDVNGRVTPYANNMFDATSLTNLTNALRPGTNYLTAIVLQQDRTVREVPALSGIPGTPYNSTTADLHFNLELFVELGEVDRCEPGDCCGLIGSSTFDVRNPYRYVQWDTWNQYKAGLHTHTWNSDGWNSTESTMEAFYQKGFNVVAITDHSRTRSSPTVPYIRGGNPHPGSNSGTAPNSPPRPDVPVSASRLAEMHASTNRIGRPGLIYIPYTNEPSWGDHFKTYWTTNITEVGHIAGNMAAAAQSPPMEINGHTFDPLMIIGHPGRYTLSPCRRYRGQDGGTGGAAASHNPIEIEKYVSLFRDIDPALGMEITNKLDGESRSDRILWDNILRVLMAEGRDVWGFSNDDSHSDCSIGYAYNLLLMPSLELHHVHDAMVNGAFLAFSRVDRRLNLNVVSSWSGNITHLHMLGLPRPVVNSIVVDDVAQTISIDAEVVEGDCIPGVCVDARVGTSGWWGGVGTCCTRSVPGTSACRGNHEVGAFDVITIEWIADGDIIHTGPTLDLSRACIQDLVDSYVRAHVRTRGGVIYVQPFGLEGGQRPANDIISVGALPGHSYLPNGTAPTAAAFGLPPTVRIETTRPGIRYAVIDWDFAGAGYEPGSPHRQDLTFNGTVVLPVGVTNGNAVDLAVSVDVTVLDYSPPMPVVAEWRFNRALPVFEGVPTSGVGIRHLDASGGRMAHTASLRRHKVDETMVGSGASQHITFDSSSTNNASGWARVFAWIGGIGGSGGPTHNDYFGNYIYMELSTEGFGDLSLSFDAYASSTSTTGRLRVEYQIGGEITDPWTVVDDSVVFFTGTGTGHMQSPSIDLPATLADQPLVRIRIMRYVLGFEPGSDYLYPGSVPSTTGPNNASAGRSGNVAFRDIVISGDVYRAMINIGNEASYSAGQLRRSVTIARPDTYSIDGMYLMIAVTHEEAQGEDTILTVETIVRPLDDDFDGMFVVFDAPGTEVEAWLFDGPIDTGAHQLAGVVDTQGTR